MHGVQILPSRRYRGWRREHNAMKWLFQPLLMLVAGTSTSDLIHQLELLKAENVMLRRRLPRRLVLTEPEKRLIVKLGQRIAYPSFRRWGEAVRRRTEAPRPYKKGGRSRTPEHIRELVLKLARENDWGYTRILGELRKLGIKTSRSNVINILRGERLDPKIDPGKGTWQTS